MSSTEDYSFSHSSPPDKLKGTLSTRFRWPCSWHFIMGSVCYSVSFTGYNSMGYEDRPGLIQYMIIVIFVGLPIFYAQTFLGQYCQMGMLNFRHIMPMARGLMYSFLCCVLMKTIRFGYTLTDVILYFLMSFQPDLPWANCPKKYENICNGYNITKGYPHTAYVFWRYIYAENPTLDIENIDFSLPQFLSSICFCLQWGIMFIITVASYWNHLKITRSLFCVHISILLILVITMFTKLKNDMTAYTLIFSQTTSLVNVKTWLLTIRNIIVDLCLADLYNMYSGAHLSKTSLSGTLSFCCVSAISLSNFLASSLTCICYSVIKEKYPNGFSVVYPHELGFGVGHILIVIPQGLSTLPVPQWWCVLFFISCICTLISNQMLHLLSMQMTIADMYPNFAKYRIYLIAGCCLFGFGTGILLHSNTIYISIKYAMENGVDNLMVTCIFVWTITVYWVYNVSTLSDDIQFLMGTQPTKFWKITWYISPSVFVLSIAGFFYVTYHIHRTYIIINICMCMLLIIPFGIFFVLELFANMSKKNLLGTFQPHRKWGPPDMEDRVYRKFFNPSTETKYQAHKMICHHNCLLTNVFLKTVLQQENALREEFFIEHKIIEARNVTTPSESFSVYTDSLIS